MNDVGKPCAREPHARFDRGPLANLATNEMDEQPTGQRPVPKATQDNQRPTSPLHPTRVIRASKRLMRSIGGCSPYLTPRLADPSLGHSPR